MNKIFKNIALLSFALLLASCGTKGSSNSSTSNIPSPTNPERDIEEHLIEGTIHDFDYSYEEGKTFISRGVTDYVILSVKNDFAYKAAKYIAAQLNSATGVDVPVSLIGNEDVVQSSQKAIVIGSDISFETVGLTKTTKDIGITGYEIQTKGEACYIISGGDEGYELAAIKFLELVAGYDLIYNDYIIFERDSSILPRMHIVERPDFDYRKTDDKNTGARYGSGFTDNIVFATVGGIQYHTSFQYLPPEKYGSSHPEWFTDLTIRTGLDSNTKGQSQGQLCYTAHGNNQSLALMKSIVADKLIETIENNPTLYNATFTIEDNHNECDCETCAAVKEEYNDSIAATIVLFLNDVDTIVQEYLENKAREEGTPKREFYVCFFAYHATEKAPVKYENGQYIAVNNIHTNEHVCVFIAPISSSFTHSFYEKENEDAALKVRSWAAISEHIYSWVYTTNFSAYLYPYNSFTSMPETYRFLKENHCSLVYPQDQHDTNNKSVFSRLKYYINSKLLINVNLNVNDIIDKFFKVYYEDAADIMRQYFEEMRQWTRYQEIAFTADCNGTIYNVINKPELWNQQTIIKWKKYCEDALKLIEPMKNIDGNRYNILYEAILVESLSPRWIAITLFETAFASSELLEERKAFKNDCSILGIDRTREVGSARTPDLAGYYENWGV